jgi:PD-(D/E)XK nuclease superfamily protein
MSDSDPFDTAASPQPKETGKVIPFPKAEPKKEAAQPDHAPKMSRGRYIMPNPVTGKTSAWTRVSNLIKLAEDTYHLDRWKMRNVVRGLAVDSELYEQAQGLDVKADKEQLNGIVEDAIDRADAYKMADEGTALHASTEAFDQGGWAGVDIPDRHWSKMKLYDEAIERHGLTVIPDMIERFTISTCYDVGGRFDRVMRLNDGTNVVVDLKTGDSIDLALPSIAAQLECYADGINTHGVWNGRRYDDSIKVRSDFALVIHLPSTRDEVRVWKVDLQRGRDLLGVCMQVRDIRRIKARDVAQPYVPYVAPNTDALDQDYIERLNAAHTVAELVSIATDARDRGEWNDRLAGVARNLAKEIRSLG